MRWMSLSLTAVLVLGVAYVSAGDECCKTKLKSVDEKVAVALESWRDLSERLATMCPDTKASLDREFAAASSECPIGSRVPSTIAYTHDALEAAVQADAALGKCCGAECPPGCKMDGDCAAKAAAQEAGLCPGPEACATGGPPRPP